MKKSAYFFVFIIFLLIVGCNKNKNKFEIIFESKENFSEKLYTSKENYSVYSHNGTVYVMLNGEKLLLKDALEQDKISMDKILEKAKNDFNPDTLSKYSYSDGGSQEYPYKTYTLIDFNTLDGNNDIYFAPPKTTINDIEQNNEMDIYFEGADNGLKLLHQKDEFTNFNTFSYNGIVSIVYTQKILPIEDAIKEGLDMSFVYYKIERQDFQKRADEIKTYQNKFKVYPYHNYKAIKFIDGDLYFVPKNLSLNEIEKLNNNI